MTNMTGMYVKLDTKSARVKGVAFHPVIPQVLMSLHTGQVQLFDYENKTLIETFEEHEGPVRAVGFHPSQPLFVSGGDDYKVKVWSLVKRGRSLFTLTGHLDYIRTVQFHTTYPFICSASDDQTVRLWNWQSRQSVAILAGHNHYVMCARMRDDLLLSASLDQTLRVWDLSVLRTPPPRVELKQPGAESSASKALLSQSSRALHSALEMLSGTEVVTKFTLEGHERGVNWGDFHPTENLIVSASDDRTVKLWRFSESKCWEVDTLRGHFNNVSSVVMTSDLIISDSEDRTIRVWDLHKRTLLQTFRRDHDRFWVLAVVATAKDARVVVAAGHDTGCLVFKLDKQRPLVHGNFSVERDKRTLNVAMGESQSSVAVGTLTKPAPNPMVAGVHSVQSNPFMPSTEALVQYAHDNGVDVFVMNPEMKNAVTSAVHIPCAFGCWIGRQKVAIYSPVDTAAISIVQLPRDKHPSRTVSLASLQLGEKRITGLFAAGMNRVAVVTTGDAGAEVHLVDVAGVSAEQPTGVVVGEKIVVEQKVKNIVASGNKFEYLAICTRSQVVVVDRQLRRTGAVFQLSCGGKIKSAAFVSLTGSAPVLIFATSTGQLRYLLPELAGSSTEISGLLQTISDDTSKYLLKPTLSKTAEEEIKLKRSILHKELPDVIRGIMKQGRLNQGNVIIDLLRKHGYPEIALQFVQDPDTRLALALEFGNLAVAMEAAEVLTPTPLDSASHDETNAWKAIGQTALNQGQASVAEIAFQKAKDFQSLLQLYAITGNVDKLKKLAKIADARGDISGFFLAAVLANDPELKLKALTKAGLGALAQKVALAPPIPSAHADDWPLTEPLMDIFPQISLPEWATVAADTLPTKSGADAIKTELEDEGDVVAAQEAWGVEDDLLFGQPDVASQINLAGAATSAVSRLPGELVAMGQFSEALEILAKRIDLVNAAPFERLFIEIFATARVAFPGLPFSGTVTVALNAGDSPTDQRPWLCDSVGAAVVVARTKDMLKTTTQGKFNEALAEAKDVLLRLTLAVAESEEEEKELAEALTLARDYALALMMEITRRANPDNLKHNLELSCYFACANLQPAHSFLATRTAMVANFKAGNFVTAAGFAKKIVNGTSTAAGSSKDATDQAKKVLAACEEKATESLELDFDHDHADAGVCAGSLTRIRKTDEIVKCAFCGALYKEAFRGSLCQVCTISRVGGKALGVQFRVKRS